MKVTVQSIHTDVAVALKERLKERLYKIAEKYNWIREGAIHLKTEKNNADKDCIVEFLLKVPGTEIYARGQDISYEMAAHHALTGLRHQLKKHKGREFGYPVNTPLKAR